MPRDSAVRLHFPGHAGLGAISRRGLPLTHYIRIVRAIMLKGAAIENVRYDTGVLIALMLLVMTIAVTRFRRTLD